MKHRGPSPSPERQKHGIQGVESGVEGVNEGVDEGVKHFTETILGRKKDLGSPVPTVSEGCLPSLPDVLKI